MKNSCIFFAALLGILFLQTGCNKDGAICFDFAQNTTVATNAVTAPGQITVTKSLGSALVDQLTSKGVKIDQVDKVDVSAITITIPTNAGYTFADISAAEVTVNGISLGKLPANSTGLTATFSAPTQSDFKSAFLSGNASMVFTATFTKAVPASTLSVQIPLNTCYKVL